MLDKLYFNLGKSTRKVISKTQNIEDRFPCRKEGVCDVRVQETKLHYSLLQKRYTQKSETETQEHENGR